MNMKDKIENAKKQAEEELDRKIELSKQPGVDIRDVLTDEDFDEICRRNEFFNGTQADFSKAQRHERLSKAAQWLGANSIEVHEIEVEPISKDRPNAIVILELKRLVALKGIELRAFTAMCSLADTVFMSSVKDGTIRFTFGVEGIWK